MRVLITGATGTIGLAVADALRARGDQVLALSRDPERGRRVLGSGVEAYPWVTPTDESPPPEALAAADAVIHLLGEPVAQRWTDEAKARIRDSRVLATRSLVAALGALPESDRPRVLVSQSATGFYGDRGDAELDERAPAGDDFLAEVVVAWEREALGAESMMRVACTRTGVVLSPRAVRWPRCSRSSSSGSADRSPAAISTSRGSISMTWSGRCSPASTRMRSAAR